MSPLQRQRTLDQFSDPKSTIPILLSSDVGAVGLNIQAANIILMVVSDLLNIIKLCYNKLHIGPTVVRARLSSDYWPLPTERANQASICADVHC